MQKFKKIAYQSFIFGAGAMWRIVLLMVCIGLFPCNNTVSAEMEENTPWPVPVKAVKIINEDDQGMPLKYPSSVFFDKTMQEIYVVSGTNGRINIYDMDFFPRTSVGSGRGIDSPNGLFVAADGRLFVCQGGTAKNPPRLTILSAAFFPVKDVLIQQFPEAETFVPHHVCLGHNGIIYVSGVDFRGLMVLDSEGSFLRWLKPQDKIWQEPPQDYSKLPPDIAGSVETGSDNLAALTEKTDPAEKEQTVEEEQREIEMANLPDFLKPKDKEEREEAAMKRFGPVMVTDVVCGSDGSVYVLSEETSKVYVFNAAEKFQFAFGKKGGSSGKMSRPRSLAVDEKRKCIYVVDYMRHTILVYNAAGRFLFEIGGKGSPPRWFNFPTDITLNSDGNLIVADLFNQRVQVLDVKFDAGIGLFGSGDLAERLLKEKLSRTLPGSKEQ